MGTRISQAMAKVAETILELVNRAVPCSIQISQMDALEKIKPGMLIGRVFEVLRPAKIGEIWKGEIVNNNWGNKFLLRPLDNGPDEMWCLDYDAGERYGTPEVQKLISDYQSKVSKPKTP